MIVECGWTNKIKGITRRFCIVSYPEYNHGRLPELKIEGMFAKSLGEDKAKRIISSPKVVRLGFQHN